MINVAKIRESSIQSGIRIFHRVPSRSEAWPRMSNYSKIWAEEQNMAQWLTSQNSEVCFETVFDKYSELWELTSFYAFRFLLVHLVVKHNAPLWITQLFAQWSASRKLFKATFLNGSANQQCGLNSRNIEREMFCRNSFNIHFVWDWLCSPAYLLG